MKLHLLPEGRTIIKGYFDQNVALYDDPSPSRIADLFSDEFDLVSKNRNPDENINLVVLGGYYKDGLNVVWNYDKCEHGPVVKALGNGAVCYYITWNKKIKSLDIELSDWSTPKRLMSSVAVDQIRSLLDLRKASEFVIDLFAEKGDINSLGNVAKDAKLSYGAKEAIISRLLKQHHKPNEKLIKQDLSELGYNPAGFDDILSLYSKS